MQTRSTTVRTGFLVRLSSTIGVLALILTGCSSIADPGPEAADESSTDIDEDAPFRYAYTLGPSRFDPHRATSSFDATSLFPTYDRLIHLTPDAELAPGAGNRRPGRAGRDLRRIDRGSGD